MARDLSCPSGLKAYKVKADAEAAAPEGVPVKRCDRCRWWHVKEPRRRQAERRAKRAKRR
jgi:hypothetical protein